MSTFTSSSAQRGSAPLARGLFASFALFVALTCLLPTVAHGQEVGRFVVVLEPTGKKASKIAQPLLEAIQNSNHIVLNQDELIAAGKRQGVTQANFWDDLAVMGRVAKAENIDAIVAANMEMSRKKYKLNIYVFDARTGETMGNLEVSLGKKPKISSSTQSEILQAANELILATGARPGTMVTLTVTSTPAGATVMRENQVVGTTPLETKLEKADRTEVWELLLGGAPAGIARVDLSKDGTYDIALTGAEDLADPEAPYGAAPPGDNQLALLELDAGVRLTSRSLDVTVVSGSELSYTSNLYPVIAVSLTSFPLVALVDNDYLKGIGLMGEFGMGSLESQLPPATNGRPLEASSGCKVAAATGVMTCPTTHTEFSFGGMYRWLMTKDADGALNALGMALDVSIAYSWLVFDIDANPTYEGHGYQAVDLGVAFSSPLGGPALRGQVGFNYRAPVAFGHADMIENWGLTAEGMGIGVGAAVSYEFFKGLFASAQYDLSWFETTYGESGCQDAGCTIPTGAVASDTYHQIGITVGYRLH